MVRKMADLVKAVVFDMDGVLFDTERLFMDGYKEAATRWEASQATTVVGELNYDTDEGKAVEGAGDLRTKKVTWTAESVEKAAFGCVGLNERDTRALFLKECGEDFPFDALFDECRVIFKDKVERDGLPLKPGVRELLQYLKESGYRIALASSTGKRGVLGHLERAGLTDYFEVIIGGDMITHGKPAPDIYLKACEELGVVPKEAFAIEDSANGLRSAHSAGLKPVMVPDLIMPTPEIEALLFAKVDTLHDVREMLMIRDGVLKEAVRIPLERLCNTRDLGGYQTTDGRQIRKHRLIRSGALFEGTQEDLAKLVSAYELKTVVDFRTASESSLKPDPAIPGVTYIANPILEEEAMGITREDEEHKDGNAVVKKVISAIAENGSTPLDYMKNMYRNLITNPFSRAQYRQFFEILLAQKEGAVLWHCSAGKDRVGVGTILLLSALSVPREQIMADYMKVNEFGKEDVDCLMKVILGHDKPLSREEQAEAAAIRLLFTVDRAYAESVFATMEAECGSVDAFLEKEMGLTAQKRAQLQEMYLE